MTMPQHRHKQPRAIAKAVSHPKADARLILFGATLVISSILLFDLLLGAGRLIGP